MSLTFPGARPVYDRLSHILMFRARDGLRVLRCGVTRDALLKLADASVREAAVSSVYEANLLRIRAVAQRKYHERRFELDGVILVSHADL